MAEVWSIPWPLVGPFAPGMKESSRFALGLGHEAVDKELDPNDADEGSAIFADPVVGLALQRGKGVAEKTVKSRSGIATFRGRDDHFSRRR